MPDAILTVAQGVGGAFLAGEWEPAAMTRRGQRAVGQRRVWVRDLAAAVHTAYPEPPRDRPRELAVFIAACPSLRKAWFKARQNTDPPLGVRRWFLTETAMGEQPWSVLPLATIGDLQDLLGLRASKLAWFADRRQLERRVSDERLRHYRYRWSVKGSGGFRLIEEPKSLLKHFQRVLLREILQPIPLHPAAHGFRTGRSALTHAAGHVAAGLVVHLDLEDFFGSVSAARVYGIYRRCGYPEAVSHLLTSMVTNSVPRTVWAGAPRPAPGFAAAHHRLGQHLVHPHLPQGAPTSPALANLAAFGLDRRLSGLAARAGLTYSRYADDLALSSASSSPPRRDHVARLVEVIRRIAVDEGFRLNERKTTARYSGQRQRLAGIVVNAHPNLDRREYDRLKATLTNASRHGPAGQNHRRHPDFRAHLLGRVTWVEHLNRPRGERLRAVFDQIDWHGVDQ